MVVVIGIKSPWALPVFEDRHALSERNYTINLKIIVIVAPLIQHDIRPTKILAIRMRFKLWSFLLD